MPICPKCSATIHTGAEDQCPACGYSLHRADRFFGTGQVEFTRVVDAAGALTHQERQELLHFLENLERDIPPAALCIYITDDGRADEFRTHAHWILNHARIHHPSFGRREKLKAIEDAELRVRITKETPREELATPVPEVPRTSWLSRLSSYVRDAFHPHLPPPVRQEWMLILVLDVQLERACFSWGYQLDPYINPDSITRCIVGAKLQFRERAMVAGLRRVMRSAVTEIASCSRRVNARLRRSGRALSQLLLLAAPLALFSLCPAWAEPAAAEASAPAAATLAEDDVAEEVTPPAPQSPAESSGGSQTPAAEAAPAPEPGAPATYAAQPRWSDQDFRHLMAGELPEAYTMLMPPVSSPRPAPRFRTPPATKESDRKVLGRYLESYRKPAASGLMDPQGFLSVEERRDVEHVLRELNADRRFRLYVALYRAGQQLPPELAVQTLADQCSQPLEYSVLLMFPLGDSQLLDIGYVQIQQTDEDRHAWLQRVRIAAAQEGHGVDALLLAVRELHTILSPLAANFTPVSPEKAGKPELIHVEYLPETGEKKVPPKERIEAFFKDESNWPLVYALSAAFLTLGLAVLYFLLRRRSGHLIQSEADDRLSSPYGAGVSRYVRYLEGKESAKESRIF